MTKAEHSAFVDGIHTSFDTKDWFCTWRALVADRSAPAGDDHRVLPLRETILEALSDSSAEQFLSPLTARHLRRYGRTWSNNQKGWFWVRTEWGKVDLSYGVAPQDGFDGKWNRAWKRGVTGDLGQIEVKVCYAHQNLDDKLRVMADQLRARRDYDQSTKGDRGKRKQRYHGIVWLFQHGRGSGEFAGVCDEILKSAKKNKLRLVEDFERSCAHHEMGPLWPAHGGGLYDCVLDLALFELKE